MKEYKIKYDPRKKYYFKLLLFNDHRELEIYSKENWEESCKNIDAFFEEITWGKKIGHVCVYSGCTFNCILHECVHAAFFYFKHLEIKRTEEYFCSILEYITGCCYNITGFKHNPDLEKDFSISSDCYEF